MSNRPNTRTRHRRRAAAAQPGASRTAIGLGVGAAVAVLIAIVIAVAVGGGDGDGTDVAQLSDQIEVSGAGLPAFPEGGSDPAAGAEAPTIEGMNMDGAPITVDPGDGTPSVLVFAAHWCPHCQAEIPRIAEPFAERSDELEIVLVSTSVDEQAPNYPPSEWLTEEGWSTPVLMDDADNTAANAYGLSTFPFFVFVDSDGNVVERRSGEQDTENLLTLVDSLA